MERPQQLRFLRGCFGRDVVVEASESESESSVFSSEWRRRRSSELAVVKESTLSVSR